MATLRVYLICILLVNVIAPAHPREADRNDESVNNCRSHCDAWNCRCSCYKPPKSQVRCADKKIKLLGRFPDTSRYSSFDFTKNDIETIGRRQFAHVEFTEMVNLQLAANNISVVKDQAFHGLNKLQSLFLNNNHIRELDEGVFSGLVSLERLFLNDNKISRIMTKTFHPIAKTLKLLYLQNNEIRTIQHHVFNHMNQLQTLDLSTNQLLRLDAHGLSLLPTLRSVFLSRNPWSCHDSDICAIRPLLKRGQKGNTKFKNLKIYDEKRSYCVETKPDTQVEMRIELVRKQESLDDATCGQELERHLSTVSTSLMDKQDGVLGSGSTGTQAACGHYRGLVVAIFTLVLLICCGF